jgi:hypothetical protein
MSVDAKAAIARARREVLEESMSRAVALLKKKLQEQTTAQTVLDNIQREIAELELRIEQGNI